MYEKSLILQHVAEQNVVDSSRWPISHSFPTRRSSDLTGASRETDVFKINITPLIFSVEFINYQEMINYYMPF
jgi:hypothetical protein